MVWTMRGPAATQAMTGERCNRQLSLSPHGGQSTFISKSTDKTPQIFVFKRKRHERHYSWTFLQHYFCMLLKKSRKKNSSHDIVLDVHVIITILLCKYLLIFIDQEKTVRFGLSDYKELVMIKQAESDSLTAHENQVVNVASKRN